MDQFQKWCKENPLPCAVVVVVVILLVFWLIKSMSSREHMGEVFYLDQMTMKHPDPTLFHYTGRERDVTGMDQHDYYLENDMNARNLAAPYYFEGVAPYEDHTDYLGMPTQYRPKIVEAGIIADTMPAEKKANLTPEDKSSDKAKPPSMAASETSVKATSGAAAEQAAAEAMAHEGFY